MQPNVSHNSSPFVAMAGTKWIFKVMPPSNQEMSASRSGRTDGMIRPLLRFQLIRVSFIEDKSASTILQSKPTVLGHR